MNIYYFVKPIFITLLFTIFDHILKVVDTGVTKI
jgi:hypothetical protein